MKYLSYTISIEGIKVPLSNLRLLCDDGSKKKWRILDDEKTLINLLASCMVINGKEN